MGNFHSAEAVEYTVAAESQDDPSRSSIYRAVSHPNGLVEDLVDEEMHSGYDVFRRGLKMSRNRPMLGRRFANSTKFEWWTYAEVEAMSLLLGTALLRSGLVSDQEFAGEEYAPARRLQNLGVCSKNRVEWFVTEQAANAYSLTLVPLYDTLGDAAIKYILEQTHMKIVACSLECAQKLLGLLLTFKDERADDLKALLLFDRPTEELEALAAELGIAVHFWISLMEDAKPDGILPTILPTPDTVNTICYTSGTTGNPKGAILTHRQFSSTVAAALRGPLADPRLHLTQEDTHVSYLPLAHVFERAICALVMCIGARIGVYSGDNLKLLDDVKLLQPTIFISVPRLFMRINDKIMAGIKEKSALAQFLFSTGLNAKVEKLQRKADPTDALWDALIFNKLKNLLGGKVRFMLVGGAPLDAALQERMAVLFSAYFLEGYGLTETMGATCIRMPHDPTVGHVGGMLACDEFCLESVPEMNYLVTDECPRGELLIRGHSVTVGYFGQSQLTKEAFTEDKFFRTGDIAAVLPCGQIKLIDRKKNIFKLAQGEYVAPERVEGICGQATLVAQIFVHGESSKNNLVGIVVPDEDAAKKWQTANASLANQSFEQLCKNDEFKKAVIASMAEVDGVLKGFEKVKTIVLTSEPFSVENNLLTPTFKIKRFEAKKYFATDIERMYKEIDRLPQRN